MVFEKEVRYLLDCGYSSENEKDIVTRFCSALNDSNHTLLEENFSGYYSYKRNSIALNKSYNEDSFNTIEEIYKKIKSNN
jgi:hypothetical protein